MGGGAAVDLGGEVLLSPHSVKDSVYFISVRICSFRSNTNKSLLGYAYNPINYLFSGGNLDFLAYVELLPWASKGNPRNLTFTMAVRIYYFVRTEIRLFMCRRGRPGRSARSGASAAFTCLRIKASIFLVAT